MRGASTTGADDVKTVPELLIGVLEQVGVVKRSGNKDRTSTDTTMSARMGVGSWIILIVLLSPAELEKPAVHFSNY